MYNFNALLERLKYIPRWSLMRLNTPEDVAQHTTSVMVTAHTLCMLANNKFDNRVNSEKVVLCALYHDVSEILTGDMPTPVKYNNQQIQSAYKEIEATAVNKLLETAHPDVKDELSAYMHAEDLSEYEKKILKAADRFCALFKCIEELQSGNKEFESAFNSTIELLKNMQMPEVEFFMENMLDGFYLCLDELAKI